MGWLDKLLGRRRQEENQVTPEEHRRHLEQSAHPGTAPVVPPDTGGDSADEVEESRQEPRGEERVEEARLRDGPEAPPTREPPRTY